MRPIAILLGALACALLAAAPAPDAQAPARTMAAKTGIDSLLLITIDTLRADHVGAYGGPVATPAIDRLASQGALVESAYTPTPSTGPAHASLLTGLYVWNHRAEYNAVLLDPRIHTTADAMKANGMKTAAFVSSYILHRRFGFHQGFDTYVFEPSESYVWRGKNRKEFWVRGEATTKAAKHWLTANFDQPFFLWVHYFDPHWPYQPPVGYAVSPHDNVTLEGKRVPKDQNVRDRRHLRELIRAYRGEVAYTDAQVGDLLERVKMLGLDERTAVVLTADHGEGLGDHGVMEHGLNLYEELLRVPLIVRAPGIPAGRRLVGPAQLEDLKPTMLALVGAEDGAPGDGDSLLPWLQGKTDTSPRSLVVGTRAPNKGKRTLYYVRDGSLKWIGAAGRDGLRVDLALDPQETKPEKGEGMPAALSTIVDAAEKRSEHVADRPVDPDPEVREALEALGYLDD